MRVTHTHSHTHPLIKAALTKLVCVCVCTSQKQCTNNCKHLARGLFPQISRASVRIKITDFATCRPIQTPSIGVSIKYCGVTWQRLTDAVAAQLAGVMCTLASLAGERSSMCLEWEKNAQGESRAGVALSHRRPGVWPAFVPPLFPTA